MRIVSVCTAACLLPIALIGGDSTGTPASKPPAISERSVSATSGPDEIGSEETLTRSATRLREQFDTWLKEPENYRKKALQECSVFPEGRIYPFGVPALAYANLGLNDAKQRRHCAAQTQKLIDLLISTVAQDMSVPDGDLNGLTHYQNQATRLATLNLTLAAYALISEDQRYNKLHAHVTQLLRNALIEQAGMPIASYPEYTWHFDTIMALVSLEMFDRAHGLTQTQALMKQHFTWIQSHATDQDTGLPIAYAKGLPRGCDISMQICLLQQVDSTAARRLYSNYVKHHWIDYGFMAGFREWPKSKNSLSLGDVDSGPLALGLGPTATGVGIGAARAVQDTSKLRVLAAQLEALPNLLHVLDQGGQALFGGTLPINRQYLTGFLYGDMVLFYAVTWVPYPNSGKKLKDKTATQN